MDKIIDYNRITDLLHQAQVLADAAAEEAKAASRQISFIQKEIEEALGVGE